jgi:hypothetical protein
MTTVNTDLRTTTVVLVVRDPDYSNEFDIYPGSEPGVSIFDIDLGRADLKDREELRGWQDCHMQDVRSLQAADRTDAAAAYQAIVDRQGE